MKVLVTGATGLIGSAVVTALLADGVNVLAVARAPSNLTRDRPGLSWAFRDLRRATSPTDWTGLLGGVDAVVNCAGALQDSARDSVGAAHRDGPAALFHACEAAGVRRVIHLSAIGLDEAAPTPFSQTKRQGDAALMASSLDWLILRPSVVFARAAYGGSALIRALATLPIAAIPPNASPIQPVMLDDVVATIAAGLKPGAPSRMVLDLPGPTPLAFEDVVALFRRWLGYPPARTLRAPGWLMALAWGLGDFAGMLGWRSPVRSTARLEMTRGATGDPAPWAAATGIRPRSLEDALAAEPASVQERWFARLYFLKPIAFAVFSIFWIGTGVVSLTIGWDIGVGYLLKGGMGDLSGPSVVAGALADIAIGLGIAYRPWTRRALWAAVAISLGYAVAGSVVLPSLWQDPLGPLWKIWPILAFNFMLLAILDER